MAINFIDFSKELKVFVSLIFKKFSFYFEFIDFY